MRAPTRALGDLQLKHAEFNFHSNMPDQGYMEPIPSHNFSGPYINYLPDIIIHTLTNEDRYLVLASDGLWDEVNRKESAEILTKNLKEKNTSEKVTRQICKLLKEECLNKAAKNSGLSRYFLDTLRPSSKRRGFVDDITIVAIDLQG